MIDNFNTASRFGRLFIPANTFSGIGDTDGTSSILGYGTNTPPLADITGITIGGVEMSTATDDVSHMLLIPRDWDTTQDVHVRCVYTTDSTTAADDVDWTITYDIFGIGDALDATFAATALDTAIAADTYGTTTDFALSVSPAGIIAASKFTPASDYALAFTVTIDTADPTNVWLLGVEFSYLEKPHGGREGKLPPATSSTTDSDRFLT